MYNSNTGANKFGAKSFGAKPFDKAKPVNNDFPQGIRFFSPHENAPDFVKGNVVINRDEFVEWAMKQKDTIRLDLKESKEGKLYLAINTYEGTKN